MRKTIALALAVPALLACGFAASTYVAVPPAESSDAALLKGKPLHVLAPYIGNWEINDQWADGTALWARNEYRVLMNGAFVEATTWAKDGDGDPYARYRTVFTWDAERKVIVGHGFTNDGTYDPLDLVQGDGALSAQWSTGDPATSPGIRQRVSFPDGDAYRWQVWTVAPGGAGEPMPMMDGKWVRVD